MAAMIEEVEFSLDSDATAHIGVTCIFCGLPTPVHRAARKALENDSYSTQPKGHISIVRCEICGKEAPYLSSEVAEFGDFFRARRVSWVAKAYEL